MTFHEPIPRKQRKRILKRDQDRCVVCWRKYQLHIHDFRDEDYLNPTLPPPKGFTHQNPYIERRDFELITLCASCHGKIHTCDKKSPLYQLVKQTVLLNLQKSKEGRR